jgi:hypothetical protein
MVLGALRIVEPYANDGIEPTMAGSKTRPRPMRRLNHVSSAPTTAAGHALL